MKIRAFTVMLLALLAVLTLVSSVSAGCAWVLWGVSYDYLLEESAASAFGGKQPVPQYDQIWEAASAHETRQACFEHMDLAKSLLPYVKYFKCLPDTVDPREVKGR